MNLSFVAQHALVFIEGVLRVCGFFKLFSLFLFCLVEHHCFTTTREYKLADLLDLIYFISTCQYVGLAELQILQPAPHFNVP